MALAINICVRILNIMVAVCQTIRGGIPRFMICGLLYTFVEAAPAVAAWNLPLSVQIQPSQQVLIHVDLDEVARKSVPAALFGFNVPWMNFQRGYWRNNQVRPEIIEWLKPFSGAVYRYPGGEVSNWFDWQKAVGRVTSRDKQHTNFWRVKAEFGFDEFLDFVKAVNGVPLVTVNLKGTKKVVWDDKVAMKSNAEWVEYSIQREGGVVDDRSLPFCQEDKKCPVQWWELGNELDWGKGAWIAERYVSRARAVGRAMMEVDPAIKLIAHTETSPWGKKHIFDTTTDEFDKTVAGGLADIAYGYAYHPYYDGISIPNVNHYMERVINALSTTSAGGGLPTIFITEHARWPDKSMFGDWRANWAQTGNLGGAISTADYLLSQMIIPNVRAAMWHALGAWGPWQLFYVDPDDDHAYPNAVYWGLRVLRQGLLDDALNIHVSSPNASGYRGGYDVRAVFMRESAGKRYSLMTINRYGKEQKTRLIIPQWAGRSFNARQYYITGNSKDDTNVDGEENRVVMQDRTMVIRFDEKGQAVISLSAFSVSSVLIDTVEN